jgi:hypothetical protein
LVSPIKNSYWPQAFLLPVLTLRDVTPGRCL